MSRVLLCLLGCGRARRSGTCQKNRPLLLLLVRSPQTRCTHLPYNKPVMTRCYLGDVPDGAQMVPYMSIRSSMWKKRWEVLENSFANSDINHASPIVFAVNI